MKHQVVVCGAGIGGLAAACALGRLGLSVLLVDKQPHVRPLPRGEVIQPGSFAVLGSWGVLDRLEMLGARSLSRIDIAGADGERQLSLDYATLPADRSRLLVHDHGSILRAFAECLPPSVEVRRPCLVRALLHDASGRVVGVRLEEDGSTREVHADLVVAADGLSSRLRAAAGIAAAATAYPHRLLTLEFPSAGHRLDAFTALRSAGGLRLLYPLPGGRLRLYVQVGPQEIRGLDGPGLDRWGRDLVAGTPGLAPMGGEVIAALGDRRVLPVASYLAPRLAVPGMVLVGEAAHCVHPMAAQGMSSAVADAEALADLLGAALPSAPVRRAVDEALDRYPARRLPVLRHVGRMSHRAAGMITTSSPFQDRMARRLLSTTAGNPRLAHLMTYNMAGLGVRPMTLLDRLQQLGVLPDPRSHRRWAEPEAPVPSGVVRRRG